MKKKNDPLVNLRFTRDVAYFMAAVTGAGVVFSIAHGNLSQSIPFWASILLSLVICGAVLYIVDYGLKREFPYFIGNVIAGKAFTTWRTILFSVLFFGILGLRVFTSASLTWSCRKDATEAIIKKPESKDANGIAMSRDSSLNATLSALDADIALLERQIKEKEKAAYQSVGSVSKERVKNGNDPYGYHAKVISKAKHKSSATLRRQLDEKMALKTDVISQSGTTSSLLVSEITTSNRTEFEQYKERVSRNEKYYGYFGVGCLMFALLIDLLLKLDTSGSNGSYLKPKPKKKKKKVNPSEISRNSQDSEKLRVVESFQGNGTETVNPDSDTAMLVESFQDGSGRKYFRKDNLIRVDGFEQWMQFSDIKRKHGQYRWKLENATGARDTNMSNLNKFVFAAKLLGDESLTPPDMDRVGSAYQQKGNKVSGVA